MSDNKKENVQEKVHTQKNSSLARRDLVSRGLESKKVHKKVFFLT